MATAAKLRIVQAMSDCALILCLPLLQVIFAELFQLPSPPHIEVMYTTLLIELCKLQPGSLPQVVSFLPCWRAFVKCFLCFVCSVGDEIAVNTGSINTLQQLHETLPITQNSIAQLALV